MLEQIHAAAEDQRKTQMIVALGMVAYGLFALATAALGGWSTFATVGLAVGSCGAAGAVQTLGRAPLRIKRFAA